MKASPLKLSLRDNPAHGVIPIPQSRERSESWTSMVRSESDLKSENLALSVLKAVRDSSSSATKEWRTPRNDTQTGGITQTQFAGPYATC